jgi:hypothetical protein
MPVRVGSSEGLGSTVRGGPGRCESAKHTGIAFAYWPLMRQLGELAPLPLSPPPLPAVNEGSAFRVAAEPLTDISQRIERLRLVAAKRCSLSCLRRGADRGT